MSTHTRIQHRDFICKGEEHHRLRMAVRLRVTDDGNVIERSAEFSIRGNRVALGISWTALPFCPNCGAIAEESTTYDPSLSSIPAAERMQVWLSPDGQRVAVPGKRDAIMPSRYLVAGYRTLEAHSLRDIDRIEQIRAAQTGNEVASEMNFSEETRRWNAERPYDEDGLY